ncbi:hypothetical protein, partial [Vibrio vulnificus]|uniref:hypothetical protein n=1 Tax=Vibrio vulnificus TaxID=672 RepID=UPI0019D456FE
ARRAYHFQQLASSSTPFHECRTYYLKSGAFNFVSGISNPVSLFSAVSDRERMIAIPLFQFLLEP